MWGVYVYHVHTGAQGGKKSESDPLELGLKVIVSYYGGAGN